MALAPGTIIRGNHDYKIDSVLGQGGYGITYLASSFIMVGNIRQNVKFTIKEFFMKQNCNRAADGSVQAGGDQTELKANLDDFVKEAEHLKAIKHPGVVAVNEIMRTNNTVYYVMEYLGSQSLGKYLKQKGKLDEQEAKLIVTAVGNALQHLHEKKMTHLDVKPDNVMLVEEGAGQFRPVLIDFGLSKHYNFLGNMTSNLGAYGASQGFSPIEQYNGISEFSPTADVYALGATLFALLTGHAPKSAHEVTDDYLRQELEGVSPQTVQAIVQAMKMRKNERCQSVKEFLSLLGSTSSSSSTAGSSSGSETVSLSMKRSSGSGNKKMIAIAAAVVVLLGGGIAAFLAMGGSDSADKEKTEAEVTKADSLKAVPAATPAEQKSAATEQAESKKEETAKKEETPKKEETAAKTEEKSTQQTQAAQSSQSSQSSQKTQTAQPAATPKPAAPTQGTITLSKIPAKYTGKLSGGQPLGDGTITFTRDCNVGGSDYSAGQSLGGTALANGYFMADNGEDIKIR